MKKILKTNNSAKRKARAKRIAAGTWMGRNVVHRRKTDYNRQRFHLETKHLREEV